MMPRCFAWSQRIPDDWVPNHLTSLLGRIVGPDPTCSIPRFSETADRSLEALSSVRAIRASHRPSVKPDSRPTADRNTVIALRGAACSYPSPPAGGSRPAEGARRGPSPEFNAAASSSGVSPSSGTYSGVARGSRRRARRRSSESRPETIAYAVCHRRRHTVVARCSRPRPDDRDDPG
jgi:hypothetical protein